MSEAAPGDIIIGSGWQQGADGYAGIVVDHGRIVSNGSDGVQNNSSLAEIQRSHPEMVLFRYVGFSNYFPFIKFPGVDIALGPEIKSTQTPPGSRVPLVMEKRTSNIFRPKYAGSFA